MKYDEIIATRPHKVIYRTGDRCVKVFDENYSKADILNEALNQARVEETGLPIPKILEITMIDGKWAIETEFIEGDTLAALMEKNPDRMEEYLSLFIDLQLAVQGKTCAMLNKLKDKMNRKISATTLDATTRYELHTRLEGMPKGKQLCHGDFNPTNIVIDKSGTAYVIDWAHATQGNPDADAARTYLLFMLDGKKELAEQYAKLFCKKSDTAMQQIQRWIPIVAASQSVKGYPEEVEMLLSFVDVVEYE